MVQKVNFRNQEAVSRHPHSSGSTIGSPLFAYDQVVRSVRRIYPEILHVELYRLQREMYLRRPGEDYANRETKESRALTYSPSTADSINFGPYPGQPKTEAEKPFFTPWSDYQFEVLNHMEHTLRVKEKEAAEIFNRLVRPR